MPVRPRFGVDQRVIAWKFPGPTGGPPKKVFPTIDYIMQGSRPYHPVVFDPLDRVIRIGRPGPVETLFWDDMMIPFNTWRSYQ
jgi:hypothetical protein